MFLRTVGRRRGSLALTMTLYRAVALTAAGDMRVHVAYCTWLVNYVFKFCDNIF